MRRGPAHELCDTFFVRTQFLFVFGTGLDHIPEAHFSQRGAAQIAKCDLACKHRAGCNARWNHGIADKCLDGVVSQKTRFANRFSDRRMRAFNTARCCGKHQPDRAHEMRCNCQRMADSIKIIEWKEKADAWFSFSTMRDFDLTQ